MQSEDIYEPTPHGRRELHGSGTTLTPAQIALLVRFDGQLTLQQVLASLSPAARGTFEATFRSLCDRRLLAPVELDPFASRFQAQLGHLAAHVGDAEADAAVHALQRTGFFVQIARTRADVRLPQPGEPLTVLVVEDEPVLARFLESYLRLSGMRVRIAGDRAGIRAGLGEQPLPHLVLLDVMLPDADGFDVLMRMRQHPVHRRTPVIMLTGKATRQAVIKGLVAGADGYLTKPFEPEQVLRAVRTVLGLATEDGDGSANDAWASTRDRA
jgi:CheY-like chemotaxis protein